MPKIFLYFGYVFFFYSNEHEPIHVHVIHGACQVVFELIIDSGNLVEIRRRMLKGYEQMSEKNMLEAEKFIMAYSSQIVQKWIDYFVLKKRIGCTEIRKRL